MTNIIVGIVQTILNQDIMIFILIFFILFLSFSEHFSQNYMTTDIFDSYWWDFEHDKSHPILLKLLGEPKIQLFKTIIAIVVSIAALLFVKHLLYTDFSDQTGLLPVPVEAIIQGFMWFILATLVILIYETYLEILQYYVLSCHFMQGVAQIHMDLREFQQYYLPRNLEHVNQHYLETKVAELINLKSAYRANGHYNTTLTGGEYMNNLEQFVNQLGNEVLVRSFDRRFHNQYEEVLSEIPLKDLAELEFIKAGTVLEVTKNEKITIGAITNEDEQVLDKFIFVFKVMAGEQYTVEDIDMDRKLIMLNKGDDTIIGLPIEQVKHIFRVVY